MDIPKNDGELDKIAERMYFAYSERVHYRNCHGEPMPLYSQLSKQIQKAWRQACLRAIIDGFI